MVVTFIAWDLVALMHARASVKLKKAEKIVKQRTRGEATNTEAKQQHNSTTTQTQHTTHNTHQQIYKRKKIGIDSLFPVSVMRGAPPEQCHSQS
jgi:hypothetical protein